MKDEIRLNLTENENQIRTAFGYSTDLVIRKVKFGAYIDTKLLIVHIDGLVNNNGISESVIKPITLLSDWPPLTDPAPAQIFAQLKNRLITNSELTEVGRIEDLLSEVCFGNTAILVEGHNVALIADLKGWKERNIEASTTEPALHGPKESFVETMRTNTSMIRRHIRDPRLRIEERTIGAIGRTSIAIVYISGIARDSIVQEVRNRIDRISIDSIQSSGMLEEFIEDSPFSLFPTIARTERVDRTLSTLLEGRIVIMTEGTPFSLIVPCNIFMFISSPDDYYENSLIGSLLRFLRIFLFLISLMLPGMYVAATAFHPEMIPTPLALAIAAQREGLPFPALFEALLLAISFEALQEASIRAPLVFSATVSILGILVLGQITVQAGLVSPFMVIVIAITGIASMALPSFSMSISIRVLRFALLILGGILGLYGVIWGMAALLIHTATLRSFGVPYSEPIMPLGISGLGDSQVRISQWLKRKRPTLVSGINKTRQAAGQKPSPPTPEEKKASAKEEES